MYYLLSYCWILLFLFSLFNHFPCASSKDGLGWCETIQYECGNITAGFPFWGGGRPETCGIGSLELRCNIKNMITSLNVSNFEFNVLHINDTSNTLRLVRADHLGSFCSSTFNSTTLPPGIFEISPFFRNLTIFYHCNPRFHYVSNYTCPGRGVLSAYQNPNYQRFCRENFTVNVPIRFFPEENELNLTHLESVLRKGFEVKVNTDEITCEECTSSIYEHYASCSQPFRCGDQSSLLYPFWVRGREDCGHPDFKLDCSKGFPELVISDVTYRILEANYDSRIIRLATSDNLTSLCPKNSLHEESTQIVSPFPQSVLQFSPQTEMLTIYYNCRKLSSFNLTNVSFGELHCEGGRKARTNYYVPGNASFLKFNLTEHCGIKINIPVSGSSLKTLRADNLEKILQRGFDLNVNQECAVCMESKGACGYNQTSKGFVCYCNDGTYGNTCGSGKKIHGVSNKAIRIALESVAGIVFLLVILTLFLYFLRKRKTRLRLLKLKALIPLDYYSYAQVKRITKSFAEVVGTGGFGIVYRGTLSDGRVVAVKVLKDSKGNGEDFVNEVASMSKTSHVNIVALLGFCSEGSKRAIIYEFLENGSLDKFISGRISENMDWTALYRIALGVAHGLEYLHHGCQTRIVHFDIKPQNVLLDENYCPKVSDFGLAKLCEKKESILSMLDTRGTIGYIAPEMISRVYGNVSHKSDVYSYGMLVLEMIGARNKEKAMQAFASNESSIYFPEWVYRDLELGKSPRLIEGGVNSEEDELAKKMTLVGLWCIQISPQDRPAMNRVVEMMEGSLEALEVPPRPLFQIPTVPLQESSIFSEDISAYTE